MSASSAPGPRTAKINIDGHDFMVPEDTTILDAVRLFNQYNARNHTGIPHIDIPVLCHESDKPPVGVCRVCVVDVGGKLGAACILKVKKYFPDDPDISIRTDTPEITAARKGVLQLLMADHSAPCLKQKTTEDCKLEELAKEHQAMDSPYFHRDYTRGQDTSSPVILVDHEACVLCDRCVRACEKAEHFIIARRGKGHDAEIGFDLGKEMGSSDCVSCGACMFACPTGALTLNSEGEIRPIASRQGCSTEELEVADLKALELKESGIYPFHYVPETFLARNQLSVVRVTVPPNTTLFEEGDPEDTAFLILEGKIELSITSNLAHVQTHGDSPGKMESTLMSRKDDPRAGENLRRSHISVDAPLELAYDNPSVTLREGHLFGEMSCMNSYPRGVTARTRDQQCVMLEMRRNILDMLRKNKDLAQRIDEDYRQEALHINLQSVLPNLTRAAVEYLRPKVEFKRYAPHEVIYRQGEPADAFYIVRTGFVKVSIDYAGREIVLAYLPKGSHFGERALLEDKTHQATCRAEDYVELVRIMADDFQYMTHHCPELEKELRAHVAAHNRANNARLQQARYNPEDDLDEFGRQGLEEAQNMLVLDLKSCTRCDQCVTACADAHDGVTRLVRDGLRFGDFLVATACRHCQDPLCMVGCPVSAIHRATSLEVIIEDWCIGCKRCAENCPYGNINMHEFPAMRPSIFRQRGAKWPTVRKATNCNLCGGLSEPSCVYACPHDAAKRVTAREFWELVRK